MKDLLPWSIWLIALFCFSNMGAQTPTFTKPASFEDVKIHRLQLIFKTADVTDAGTDDAVYIKLNAGMKRFYLNKSGDDFERNSTGVYDIFEPTALFIRDLKDFTIGKEGTDGWSPVLIQMKVNSCLIFEKPLSNHWIDGNDGKQPELILTASAMRSAGKWNVAGANANIYIPSRIIKKYDMVNMVETLTGNYLKYKNIASGTAWDSYDYSWGDYDGVNTLFGDAVEAAFRNSQTLAIDLDLKADHKITIGYFKERDIDFNLIITCTGGNVKITNNLIEFREFDKLSLYLNRSFNVPNCTAHFEPNGDIFYY